MFSQSRCPVPVDYPLRGRVTHSVESVRYKDLRSGYSTADTAGLIKRTNAVLSA